MTNLYSIALNQNKKLKEKLMKRVSNPYILIKNHLLTLF